MFEFQFYRDRLERPNYVESDVSQHLQTLSRRSLLQLNASCALLVNCLHPSGIQSSAASFRQSEMAGN